MNKFIISDNVFSDVDLSTPLAVGPPEIEYLFEDYDYRQFTQKYVVVRSKFKRAILGSSNIQFPSAILTSETNPKSVEGGLVEFTREYVEVPSRATKEMIILSFTYPSLHWPTRYRLKQVENDAGDKVDTAGDEREWEEPQAWILRKPFTTTTSALVEYNYYVVPPHLMNSNTVDIEQYINFTTQPKEPLASSGTIFGLSARSVDYIDSTTTPHVFQYYRSVIGNGSFTFVDEEHEYTFRAEDTQVEKWIGNIYRTRDVFVQPR